MPQGIPIVVSAPSGAGKSTLIRELLARVEGLEFSVSHTTRPPRAGDVEGVDYHFVDRARFEQMVEEDAFAEWAEVHGHLYGTSFRAIEALLAEGRDVVLDIDVQGALQIADKMSGTVLIFVMPPSWEELRRRIDSRGLDARKDIERRMENARRELIQARRYQYLVVNDDVGRASRDLASIVRAERCRISRRSGDLNRLVADKAARSL